MSTTRNGIIDFTCTCELRLCAWNAEACGRCCPCIEGKLPFFLGSLLLQPAAKARYRPSKNDQQAGMCWLRAPVGRLLDRRHAPPESNIREVVCKARTL